MPGPYLNQKYAQTAGVEGVPTNANFTGAWFKISDVSDIGIQVILTATGSPTAVWALDVTSDPNAPQVADANLSPGFTTITNTAEMTAAAPNGTATNRNSLFQFGIATTPPCPRAQFARFKYVFTSGGSASLLLKIAINTLGLRP